MIRYLVLPAALALLPVAACAKTAAETAPVALEAPHVCVLPTQGDRPLAPTLAGFTVAADGSVKDVWIVDKSQVAAIDDAAKACVSAWRYRPATRDGKPVAKPWQDVMRWEMRIPPAPAGAPLTSITVAAKPPPASPNPRQPQPQPQIITPVSVGRPHTCANFYPPEAVEARAQGRVLLSFHIATDGTTKDLSIATSSGNADLDAASLSCAAQWLYRPAMVAGAPVETPWQAYVQWSLAESAQGFDTRPVRDGIRSCAAFYTPAMIAQRPRRSILLQVTVGTDGTVRDARSSETDALLDASIACVKSWHYTPALKAGTAVEATILQIVNWSMQGLLLPAPPQSCASFAAADAVAPSGLEGITGVHFRVMPDGSARDAALDRSSTSDALDQAALACAATWRFDTASLGLPPGGYPQHISIDWQRELKR